MDFDFWWWLPNVFLVAYPFFFFKNICAVKISRSMAE